MRRKVFYSFCSIIPICGSFPFIMPMKFMSMYGIYIYWGGDVNMMLPLLIFSFSTIIFVDTVKKITAWVSNELKVQFIPENWSCFSSVGTLR